MLLSIIETSSDIAIPSVIVCFVLCTRSTCSSENHLSSAANGNGVQILDVLREIIAERAKAINVSPAQWSYFQSGAREIQPQHAIRLCDLANVSLDYIYRGKQ